MGKSYGLDQPLATQQNDVISVHLGSTYGAFKPEMMHNAWEALDTQAGRRKIRA